MGHLMMDTASEHPKKQAPSSYLTHDQRTQRRADIAAEVKAGEKVSDICQKYGVTPSTVMNACREYDVTIPHCRRMGQQKCDPYIVLAYLQAAERHTLEYIAEQCGITHGRVSQLKAKAIKAQVLIPGAHYAKLCDEIAEAHVARSRQGLTAEEEAYRDGCIEVAKECADTIRHHDQTRKVRR